MILNHDDNTSPPGATRLQFQGPRLSQIVPGFDYKEAAFRLPRPCEQDESNTESGR
jgi:hypothetical protein